MGQSMEFARRNLETFFSQQTDRFRFEGIIARGAWGVTLKVTELGQTTPLAPAIPPKGTKRERLRSITPTELARLVKRVRISSAGSAVKVAVQNVNPWRTYRRSRSSNSSDRSSAAWRQEIYPRRTMAIKRPLGFLGHEELKKEIDRLRVLPFPHVPILLASF